MSQSNTETGAAGGSTVPAPDTKKLLSNAKAALSQHLARKKQLDKELINIETTLYQFETSYLAPPPDSLGGVSFGNIVKGYDSYIKAPNATLGLSERKRPRAGMNPYAEIRNEDRLFSRSSETYLRALELRERDGVSPPASASDDENSNKEKKRKRHQ